MSTDTKAFTNTDRLDLPQTNEAAPALFSLDLLKSDFLRDKDSKTDSKVLKDPYANDLQFVSMNGFGDAAAVLGGWREMGRDVQAGKGKSVQMQLGVEGGSTTTYNIPLDDIGNKKGKIVTNGKEIKFVQTDGDIWNSEYKLQWNKEKNGTYKFSWK